MSIRALSRSIPGSHFGSAITLATIVLLLSLESIASAATHTETLAYSNEWTQDSGEPVYRSFRTWTQEYVAAQRSHNPTQDGLVSIGVRLARERRQALKELMQSDPRRALALSIPASIRQTLPAQVLEELETRVSGIGDLSILAALRTRGGPAVVPIHRVVELAGQRYRAFVYGRRLDQTTKLGISLHGIAIDDILALAESSLRQLEVDEKPNPTERIVDLTSALESPSSGEMVFGKVGPTVYRFSSLEELFAAETRLEDAEAGIGPNPKHSAASMLEQDPGDLTTDNPQPNGWTTGNQNVLIIRIDFSDLPGDPNDGFGQVYTANYVQTFSDTQIKPYFAASSYGLTSLTNTATPQLYRLPHPTSSYTTQSFPLGSYELYNNAQTLASADYLLSNYDRIIVLFSDLANLPGSNILFGGLGDVGGPRVWVNGAYYWGVVAHELGHTYGMYHAGLWQVNDDNPISQSGHIVEYGDDFDTMGVNPKDDPRNDFNPYYKSIIGWISAAQIQTATTNGTYRINRFDNAASTGTLALRVTKDTNKTYWIGCRRNFTDNPSMQHGAYVTWGYNSVVSGSKSALLDMTTPGNNVRDAALALGVTFTDSAAQVSFVPVGEGGVGASQYIDVQVNFLSVPTPTPVPTLISISGAISYCSNPFPGPVPNVTLTLTGSASGSVLSDSSGSYTFSSLTSGGAYTITPTKLALTPATNTSINTVDVVAIQRHFLQISLLTGCRTTGADANGDSVVNTIDVIAIQRFFLGAPTGIANVGQYKFSPGNRMYLGVSNNQTNQNYAALIFGDVASPFAK